MICEADEDWDFDDYTLTLTVTVSGGYISSVSASGDGDPYNQTYIDRALNGRRGYTGITDQLTGGADPSGVDTVGGATCSSKAIIRALSQALAGARK